MNCHFLCASKKSDVFVERLRLAVSSLSKTSITLPIQPLVEVVATSRQCVITRIIIVALFLYPGLGLALPYCKLWRSISVLIEDPIFSLSVTLDPFDVHVVNPFGLTNPVKCILLEYRS